MIKLSRRSLLAMVPASFTFPRPSRAGESTNRTMTLDPDGPVARNLDKLYGVLKATHEPEYQAKRAWQADFARLREEGDFINDRGESISFNVDGVRQIGQEYAGRRQARQDAQAKFLEAVLESAGHADFTEAAWWKAGIPFLVVRVGDRLYVVSQPCDELHGLVDEYDDHQVNVIDL